MFYALPLSSDIPVLHVHVIAFLPEPFRDQEREGHRTVFPAGASETDREVALPLAAVSRQEIFEKPQEPGEKFPGLGPCHDIFPYSRVFARQRAQAGDKMRVRQKAQVEKQIELERDSELVAESDEGYHHGPAGVCLGIVALDDLAQVMDRVIRRIDCPVGKLLHLAERFPFLPDAFPERCLAPRQRMRSPCFAETPHERVVGGIKENELDGKTACLELAEKRGETLGESLFPDIDADRRAGSLFRPPGKLQEGGKKRQGEVIDAVKTDVLEILERGAPAGSGKPRHYDDARPAHPASLFRSRLSSSRA